jgi:hypothetical protein
MVKCREQFLRVVEGDELQSGLLEVRKPFEIA